ncbi:MAG: hypothetical protein HYZ57_10440 [Acidobacteria bacterium]|nr:hypothetical protein [Acidobacteriota bacterium]
MREFRAVGTLFADGAGSLTGKSPRFTNLEGVIVIDPADTESSGTYTVSPEGIVTAETDVFQAGVVVAHKSYECVIAGRGEVLECVVLSITRFDLGPSPVGVPTIARTTVRRQ